MQLKVSGSLTAARLREVLALIESGVGIAVHFDGIISLQSTVPGDEVTYRDALENFRISVAHEPSVYAETKDDRWEGLLPGYLRGVPQDSPAALERQRLFEAEKQQREKKYAEERARKDQLARQHEIDKQTFRRLAASHGQQFIDAINAEIAAVWRDVRPVYAHDCNDGRAGQPRLMPQVELRGRTAYFHSFNVRGSTMRIATPLSMSDTSNGSNPDWKYAAWVDHAIPRIRAAIEKFEDSGQPHKTGMLPVDEISK